MPSLATDMEEATLTEWLVAVGDEVAPGDIIAVIETDKGAIDMEVFHHGIISQLCIEPVVTVPVGTVMARTTAIGKDVEPTQAGLGAKPAAVELAQVSTVTERAGDVVVAGRNATPADRVLATPLARQLAKQAGINLFSVSGTGPEGAVLAKDLPETQPLSPLLPATEITGLADTPKKRFDTAAMRRAIASAMEKSKREIPHYYLSLDIDITSASMFVAATNAAREPEQRLLLLAVLLRAVAKVLARFPQLNGYYQDGLFTEKSAINIGNAISLRAGGLVVPAILSVERLTLDQTMNALRDVTDRSRNGHLRSSELLEATITVTNIGDRGADAIFGIIYPPQVAIIGVGKPHTKVKLLDGQAVAQPTLTLSLSADHRVSDGIVGAKFLNAVDQAMQKPQEL